MEVLDRELPLLLWLDFIRDERGMMESLWKLELHSIIMGTWMVKLAAGDRFKEGVRLLVEIDTDRAS